MLTNKGGNCQRGARMKLSDRKRKILQIVVDNYISTAQAVSSKNITEKYMTDVSSATVRSELAQLEELGYLSQPHTSSGRLPSTEAYKLYVSELMDKGKLTAKELKAIKNAFISKTDYLEEVVQNAVKVISDLTDYTTLAYTSHNQEETIVKLDIFRNKSDQALLLVATESTLIRDKFITIPSEMTDEQIDDATRMINKLFIGKHIGDIVDLGKRVAIEFASYRTIFESVIDALEEYIQKDSGEVLLEGEEKIFNHPEYSDVGKVKNFLSVVTKKNRVAELLSETDDDIEINVKIGGEDQKDMPADCSLVTATYSSGGVKIGTYGVIGPLRMDYQKVVSVLEGVGKIMQEIINSKNK